MKKDQSTGVSTLVADDSTLIRECVKDFLELDSRFSVIAEAHTGDEAYDLCIELRPQLLIIDIKLPNKTGLEVIRELRENDYQQNIVILSQYDDQEYRSAASDLSVSAYILKDTLAKELLPTLSRVIFSA